MHPAQSVIRGSCSSSCRALLAGRNASRLVATRSYTAAASSSISISGPSSASPSVSSSSHSSPRSSSIHSRRDRRSATKSLVSRFGVVALRPFSTSSTESVNATDKPAESVESVDLKDDNLDDLNDKTESIDANAENPILTDNATKKGATEKLSFQAETRQILDIVTNSLYTDKEVFVRELVSNASDALEKARYLHSSTQQLTNPELPFEIRITVDDKNHTLTIQDYGIGMTKEELSSNIGRIARSGCKQFVKEMSQKGQQPSNIIGQFGVGFYSTFMVADKVEVFTKSADISKGDQAYYWVSDGTGSYELSEAEGCIRGTKIILHLKESTREFAQKHTIESIIKKHSNFLGFPIFINNIKQTTTGALWLSDKSTITDKQYTDFYQHLSHAYDEPTYRLHFNTDVPLSVHSLLFFPERHMEKFGMGRMDPGVNVYSRKVLISPRSKDILPGWLRFVKGVVDSEDLPLNISRESMQDSRLLQRLNYMLTRRIIKFLEEEAKKDPKKYLKWFKEFGIFIKEGVCSDPMHHKELAKLLRFDSSFSTTGNDDTLTTLDEYISRMPPEQSNIYYLNASDRNFALKSPYYEACKLRNREVIFLYNPLDDMTMKNLSEFNKRKLVSIDSSEMANELKVENENKEEQQEKVNADDIIPYMMSILNTRAQSIKESQRFFTVPAIIVDPESAGVRKLMKIMASENNMPEVATKHKMEINLSHPLWRKVLLVKEKNPEVSKLLVEQIFDNACLAADVMDSPAVMLPRLTQLVDHILEKESTGSAAAQSSN